MAGELVFATGVTGHVGFAVLVAALKKGYRVRAAIRRPEQESELRANALIKPFQEQLEFVIVPDITVDGAFDNVLHDVIYIEHTASPAVSSFKDGAEDPEKHIILPAIRGTMSILESALKFKSIRRVVITSSATAIGTMEQLYEGTAGTIVTANSRIKPLPKAPWGPPPVAYRNSKILALDATEKFMVEKQPHFTVINIMPGYVIGPNALITDPSKVGNGSNAMVMSVALGTAPIAPGARPGAVIDLDDVARAHVEVLNEERIPGNKSFMPVSPDKMAFDDVKDIARRHFPEAVQDGTLPLSGSIPTALFETDVSEELKLFGPFKSFEEMVVSLLTQYLTLEGKQ